VREDAAERARPTPRRASRPGLRPTKLLRRQDAARDGKQNSWLAFQNKGAKRKVQGSLKGVRKQSIFAAPTTVDGKVGVTGSGSQMTEFGERKKFKFATAPP